MFLSHLVRLLYISPKFKSTSGGIIWNIKQNNTMNAWLYWGWFIVTEGLISSCYSEERFNKKIHLLVFLKMSLLKSFPFKNCVLLHLEWHNPQEFMAFGLRSYIKRHGVFSVVSQPSYYDRAEHHNQVHNCLCAALKQLCMCVYVCTRVCDNMGIDLCSGQGPYNITFSVMRYYSVYQILFLGLHNLLKSFHGLHFISFLSFPSINISFQKKKKKIIKVLLSLSTGFYFFTFPWHNQC